MTRAELAEVDVAVTRLLPPEGVTTTYNGRVLPPRPPIHTFEATLPTEIADEEGVLRRTTRKTVITIHEPLPGEVPSLYECEIPVVETGDRFHVNVKQKLPLTFERDNVPPSYLRLIRTLVFNEMHERLAVEDVNAPWGREATASPTCSAEAVKRAVTLRFGPNRVIYDPSDPEANNIAVTKGYTVIHGSSLSKGEWENVRRAGAAKPAGQETPSPKPFHPDGRPLKWLNPEEYTPAHHALIAYMRNAARDVLGHEITVALANDPEWGFNGSYGKKEKRLIVNIAGLGHGIFDVGPNVKLNKFFVHELAHDRAGNHLSDEFHEECCRVGAMLTDLALSKPEAFTTYMPGGAVSPPTRQQPFASPQ